MAPIFDYKAYNAEGKAPEGHHRSRDAKAARQKLKKQGLMVSEIDGEKRRQTLRLGAEFLFRRKSERHRNRAA